VHIDHLIRSIRCICYLRLAIREKAAQAKLVLRSDIEIGNDEVMEEFAGSAMMMHVPSITTRWIEKKSRCNPQKRATVGQLVTVIGVTDVVVTV
jgi:hypothetical protein